MASEAERVADGVWKLSGDIKGGMNVYFIEDEGGVTQFDAGTRPMTKGVKRVADELGGLKRVVLGHSHTDHRGTAPGLGVPVLCHEDERTYAERDDWPDYWDVKKIGYLPVRLIYPLLHRRWDGGAVKVSDTVTEGDEIAGFKVVHVPGHAPGQIALWRESDRLGLTTDAFYMADAERLKPLEDDEAPVVPHKAWNQSTRDAAESVRKLAGLGAETLWPGHERALEGTQEEVKARLERAADRILAPA
jgi:glyoxylase-like metal-dependent hydrolase (beta-lactamase superfamily II)